VVLAKLRIAAESAESTPRVLCGLRHGAVASGENRRGFLDDHILARGHFDGDVVSRAGTFVKVAIVGCNRLIAARHRGARRYRDRDAGLDGLGVHDHRIGRHFTRPYRGEVLPC
jgi:hypothetical protein